MIRKIILIAGLFFFAALSSCEPSQAERDREANKDKPVEAKTTVASDGSIHLSAEQLEANGIKTVQIEPQQVDLTIPATGRIQARSGGQVDVFPPLAGRMFAVSGGMPALGAMVRRGDILAEVEQQLTPIEDLQINSIAVELQNNVDQAAQEVTLRETELARARQLYEGGAIALKEFQAAEFNQKQAETKLAGARKTLEQREQLRLNSSAASRRVAITAPLTGTVVAVMAVPGQQADPSKSLWTIVDLSTVWAELLFPEPQLAAIRQAKMAEIKSDAIPGKSYSGHLVMIGNAVDAQTRTATAVFALENNDGDLRLGMSVQAEIATGARTSAFVIPPSAVIEEEGRSVVYVESESGVYVSRTVSVQQRRPDRVVVATGVKLGDRIVSVGAQALRSESMRNQIPAEDH